MNNCQICAQKPRIAFNWRYANEGKDQELARLANHLQPIRPLKFGHLYRCPVNQNLWFLDDDHLFMKAVPSDKAECLWQWDRQSLVLSDTQIKVLSNIGAAELDTYGNESSEIRIPCSIRRTRDKLYDPVLVIITKLPPIQHRQKRILLGTSNDFIAQSDFALPLSVRIATLLAEEINMGFAPTLIKSSDNQYFVISGANQIFSHGQLKGKDIALGERPFRRGDNYPIINEDIDQITFFYYDWYDDCHKLVEKLTG